jgi:hypothetical protein
MAVLFTPMTNHPAHIDQTGMINDETASMSVMHCVFIGVPDGGLHCIGLLDRSSRKRILFGLK